MRSDLCFLSSLYDRVLKQAVEPRGKRRLIKARMGDDHRSCREDEPHMLHAEDNCIISHKYLSRIAGQQVWI